ncbi:adenosylcobinamide-phosphate synthase CbiB [Bacteroides mediterraneensis]|uniref:adenosylcobinamide-phosphate synthase CbiB n=1 Tax=Bacteroides mediterraneensis TaxID=1841856 RepID=UPI0026EB0189|nr:adenosylcobinamide-phosphate synthase CbiB [Bacteroides mediterraneensis]
MDTWIEMGLIPLLGGFLLDKLLGDPLWLPHPVVGFGKLIARCERRGNQGTHRKRNGALTAVGLILLVFLVSCGLLEGAGWVHPWLKVALSVVAVFYCLAGKTLIDEVRRVFEAADISLEAGRKQVSRIVGRDTSALSDQEVRTAALETLAENLSDGVIAPLFWYFLLGVPGMLAYKMVNTLDSMIGYRNARYKDFGCWAARIDDVANYLPARLTALLMVLVSGHWSLLKFVVHYGRMHASPNSGYPEAALAGILNCRFGGPHDYFGETVYKPFIGSNPRPVNSDDMRRAIRINRLVEGGMVLLMVAGYVCFWGNTIG